MTARLLRGRDRLGYVWFSVFDARGRPVDPELGPGPLLVGTAGRPVELTVARDGELPRRFAVTPLSSDRRLRYQDWVSGRRKLVRELSGGRVGSTLYAAAGPDSCTSRT